MTGPWPKLTGKLAAVKLEEADVGRFVVGEEEEEREKEDVEVREGLGADAADMSEDWKNIGTPSAKTVTVCETVVVVTPDPGLLPDGASR